MTAATSARSSSGHPPVPSWPRRLRTFWRTRLGMTHPTRILRWLRTGVLVMVAATALLNLLVSYQADDQIAAIRRTNEAIGEIRKASEAAEAARGALETVFRTGEVDLTGVGTDFANETARVSIFVTSAAEGNAAGAQGQARIQFVQGQLTTCIQLANDAVGDFPRTGGDSGRADLAKAALGGDKQQDYAGHDIPGTGGLISSLQDLKDLQEDARDRQQHSDWLNSAVIWPLRLGPVGIMLALIVTTGLVVARHFRRHLTWHSWTALLISATVAGVLGHFGTRDASGLPAHPWAGSWWTLAVASALLALAGFLSYRSYRDRLNEYEFHAHEKPRTRP